MADPTTDGAPSPDPENRSSDKDGARSQKSQHDIQNRLNDLGRKLDHMREAETAHQHDESRSSGLAIAMRMGSEFVVAVLIGGAMGWYLDKWLGTTPFLLFVFIMFGFAAGTRNIIRLAKDIERKRAERSSQKNTKAHENKRP